MRDPSQPMAWRYRKSIKILPGIRLNLSKSGISTTVGIRGASVNFGKRGTYVNTGIPGTGLYNRRKIAEHAASDLAATPARAWHRKYKHRLWPWWSFGTIGVALFHNEVLIQVYWLALIVAWILRMIFGKKNMVSPVETAIPVAEPSIPSAAPTQIATEIEPNR